MALSARQSVSHLDLHGSYMKVAGPYRDDPSTREDVFGVASQLPSSCFIPVLWALAHSIFINYHFPDKDGRTVSRLENASYIDRKKTTIVMSYTGAKCGDQTHVHALLLLLSPILQPVTPALSRTLTVLLNGRIHFKGSTRS